jgi:hypothetical protein
MLQAQQHSKAGMHSSSSSNSSSSRANKDLS